jgi:hypothetical protein
MQLEEAKPCTSPVTACASLRLHFLTSRPGVLALVAAAGAAAAGDTGIMKGVKDTGGPTIAVVVAVVVQQHVTQYTQSYAVHYISSARNDASVHVQLTIQWVDSGQGEQV